MTTSGFITAFTDEFRRARRDVVRVLLNCRDIDGEYITYKRGPNPCPEVRRAVDIVRGFYRELGADAEELMSLDFFEGIESLLAWHPVELSLERYPCRASERVPGKLVNGIYGSWEDIIGAHGEFLVMSDKRFPGLQHSDLSERFGEQLNPFINYHRYYNRDLSHGCNSRQWFEFCEETQFFTPEYQDRLWKQYLGWFAKHRHRPYTWWAGVPMADLADEERLEERLEWL